MKLGAIDVGSNAIRLLMADVKKNAGIQQYVKIAYLRLPVRLGDDVFEKGQITPSKADRLVLGMKIFKAMLDLYEIADYRAVATSAMRDSKNSGKIQSTIYKKTGIRLNIISGKEEAELVYLPLRFFNALENNCLLVDVGGGSTEITFFRQNKILASESFQIGSVRLFTNRVVRSEWARMRNWLVSKILPLSPTRAFGLGGTINSVHKMNENMSKEPVSIHQLNDLIGEMKGLSVEERLQRFRIKEDRADVIVPAMEIYVMVLETIGLMEIHVPKMGLADGVLLDLYQKING